MGCADFGTTEEATPTVTVACTNSLTEDIAFTDWELMVSAERIASGEPFTATFDGAAVFGEDVLDRGQMLIPGGLKEVHLVEIRATVHVRSGATGDDVVLEPESIPYQCLRDGVACNPAHDLPGERGQRGNSDCEPQDASNPCGRLLPVPISSDCEPGGVCARLGKVGPRSQCDLNRFCVRGELRVPFEPTTAQYTAASEGVVLFGWDDESTGASLREDGPNAGTWVLPPAIYEEGTGPNGIRLTLRGIPFAWECTMGVDSNGPLGPGSLSFLASPTPDSALISLPIHEEIP